MMRRAARAIAALTSVLTITLATHIEVHAQAAAPRAPATSAPPVASGAASPGGRSAPAATTPPAPAAVSGAARQPQTPSGESQGAGAEPMVYDPSMREVPVLIAAEEEATLSS